jgi:uncharacterized protein YecT (DUF1311 family)
MRLPVLILALVPLPALAQGHADFDPAVITTCLADGHGPACIGRGAEACTMASPGGGSNAGWGACVEAERAWWDGQLNAVYRDRMTIARAIDAEAPMPGLMPRPSDVDALRSLQRAWITFRDTSCYFEEIQWWGGTGMGAAGNACRMRMTAEQTLYLRSQMGG